MAKKLRPSATKSSRSKRTTAKQANFLQRLQSIPHFKPIAFFVGFVIVGAITLGWASAATTTYSLWNNSAVPKTITTSSSNERSIELGLRFTPKVAGSVTGVRFYKNYQNTGTHTGSLWNSQGRLLATVTFTKETSSGWQSVTFDKPVSVAANVTYIVSYHSPKGYYSVDTGYFKQSSRSQKYLVAPASQSSQPNGIYKYSSQTAFPNTDGDGRNFWVDVMFNAKIINAPVTPAAPTNLVANLQGANGVSLKWQASSSATAIKSYDVYRNGAKIANTANTTYSDTNLATDKTYDYQVRAVDSTGATSPLTAKVSIKVPVPAPSTGGGTGGGSTGGSGSGGGNSNGGSTTGPSTGTEANLFNASKKEIAMQLVSSSENSSLNWKAQYAYIEDIGDGRGYTAGIIGFCTGCGDLLSLVQYYNKISPNNILAKYVPALQKVNGSDSHDGLGNAFVTDWKTAAKDVNFQKAQDYERDAYYFNPSVNQAIADGVHALGQFIYYDAMVMHGPGSDPVSFGGIRAAAMKKAKTPAQGGNETTYLNAFLDARKAAMLTEEAHSVTDRVDTMQRPFLQKGNLNLDPPLQWTVYGDAYSITKNP
jgi:chitosanase